MLKKSQRIALVILIMFTVIPIFTNLTVIPVAAAEEDETDDFTSMPNYRWENETITDTAVQEHLYGNDYYSITNVNNQTSSNQKFEKSRQIIDRDFEVDTKFQMDLGGNETEYFRDEIGDECDFTEGDDEDWFTVSGCSLSVSNGIFSVVFTAGLSGIIVDLTNHIGYVYTGIEIKSKSSISGVGSTIWLQNTAGDIFSSFNNGIPKSDNWITTTLSFSDSTNPNNLEPVTRLQIVDNIGIFTLEIDYIKIFGSLDYATHAENEIEDSWNWEDSNEYFYDEEDNISDFNDGSIEGWVDSASVVSLENYNGWLNCTDTNGGVVVRIEIQSLTVDASIYKYFAIELSAIQGDIDFYRIRDSGDNTCFEDTDNIITGTTVLLSGVLDADWSGVETQFQLYLDWITPAVGNQFHLNFTFLYDTELGDREGVYMEEYDYVNPLGYYTNKFLAGDDFDSFYDKSHVTLSIDTSLFDTLIIKMQAPYYDLKYEVKGRSRDDGDYYLLQSQVLITSNDWIEYTIDLSLDSDWTGLFYFIYISFYDVSGNFEGDEYVNIDYMLLTGNYTSSPIKYSLLTRDHQEGAYFQFSRVDPLTDEYLFEIDFLDYSGIALHHETAFDYSLDDGWLYLRFAIDINKKEIKVDFKYENLTEIVKERSFYALFGITGTPNLVITEIGDPRLCINASQEPYGKAYWLIDYIDADYTIMNWLQPNQNSPDLGGWFATQDMTSTQLLNEYSVELSGDILATEQAWFMLSVDRFDGFSMDITSYTEGLEINDKITVKIHVFNVFKNGSLDKLFGYTQFHGFVGAAAKYGYFFTWYNETGYPFQGNSVGVFSTEAAQSSLSVYQDLGKSTLIAQADCQKTSGNEVIGLNVTRSNQMTQEMLIIIDYEVYDGITAGGIDYFSTHINGFDLARKGWISDLVGGILRGFIDVIGFILAPFVMFFTWILSGLGKMSQAIVEGLQPFFNALGGVFTLALGALETAFGLIIEALWDLMEVSLGLIETAVEAVTAAIIALAEGIWEELIGLTAEISAFIEALLELAIIYLPDLLDAYINDFMLWWFDELLAALGLLEFFTFIQSAAGNLVAIVVVGSTLLMTFINAVAAFVVYWMHIDRLQALGLWATLGLAVWLFYPIVMLFIAFADDDYTVDSIIDFFEVFTSKCIFLLSLIYKILIFTVDIVLKTLTTIGGFIPLT